MEEEINRRLTILNKHKAPVITQRSLRGGMQERLYRQESIRYGKKIKSKTKKLKNKLTLIEQAKIVSSPDSFNTLSASSIEPLDNFEEPVFRRIRSKRGFFNE